MPVNPLCSGKLRQCELFPKNAVEEIIICSGVDLSANDLCVRLDFGASAVVYCCFFMGNIADGTNPQVVDSRKLGIHFCVYLSSFDMRAMVAEKIPLVLIRFVTGPTGTVRNFVKLRVTDRNVH